MVSKSFLIIILLLTLTVNASSVYYLSDYPKPFIFSDNEYPIAFVAGENAPSSDVLSLIKISSGLQSASNSKKLGDSFIDSELFKDVNLLNSYNIIAVGSSCENKIVEEFSSYKCDEIIRLDDYAAIEVTANNNRAVLTINGQSSEIRMVAAEIIGNYNDYDLFRGRDLEGRRELFVTGKSENPEFSFHLPEKIKFDDEIADETPKEEAKLEVDRNPLESKQEINKSKSVETQNKGETTVKTALIKQERPGLFKRIFLWLFGWIIN